MEVSESTLNVVATPPLKLIAVAPVKLMPPRTTEVPVTPLVGAKELITGAGTKLVALVPTPVEVVTVIGPVVTLAGTNTVMEVIDQFEAGEAGAASVPLNLTVLVPCVAPKLVPVIVTEVPTAPPLGLNEVIEGGGRTVNCVLLVAVPPGVVTVKLPFAAPDGTVVLIWLSLVTVNAAVVPANFTAVAPVKLVPVIVTTVPVPPLAGLKPLIVGTTRNELGDETGPPWASMVIRPVVAKEGTVAVILVELTGGVNVAVVPLKVTP
jgi:hypothetical protein